MAQPIRVLVTGVGGRSVGHQILTALLLKRDKYRIIATDAEDFSFGLYQADAAYIVPAADSADYIHAIRELVEMERIEVLLPGTEVEVRALSWFKDELAAQGCLLLTNPPEVVRLCSDKLLLYEWLDGNGYQVPQTAALADWRDLVEGVGFPLVGKPTRESGGSRNVAILKDEAEVAHYVEECERAHTQVLLQGYVESPAAEYTVGVLVSKAGELIDSIVLHRKLAGFSLGAHRCLGVHNYALSTGYSQGFIVDNPVVQEVCESLALRIGCRGPLNVQCRVSGDDVVIFEVHPRFSGSTSIRAQVGFNEPDVLIRNFLGGENFGRIDYHTDVAVIRAFQNVVVPLSEMRSLRRISGSRTLNACISHS